MYLATLNNCADRPSEYSPAHKSLSAGLFSARLYKAYGNYVDESGMIVYPEYMVSLFCSHGILRYQIERLLAEIEIVCEFMHCLSSSESKNKIPASVAVDVEDVRQSRQGDSDAYQRLIERHQAYIGKILWRFSRDRRVHEELVQDVFVEAYLSLRSYRGKAPFANWLSRIATRAGYRYWKQNARRQKRQSLSLQEWDQLDDKTVQQIDVSEAAVLVHRLLAQLPSRDRLVLTLRYLEQCDIAETARRTGWTKAMVKVQAFRARKKLQRLFERLGWEVTI